MGRSTLSQRRKACDIEHDAIMQTARWAVRKRSRATLDDDNSWFHPLMNVCVAELKRLEDLREALKNKHDPRRRVKTPSVFFGNCSKGYMTQMFGQAILDRHKHVIGIGEKR